jgi:hypothetical protein
MAEATGKVMAKAMAEVDIAHLGQGVGQGNGQGEGRIPTEATAKGTAEAKIDQRSRDCGDDDNNGNQS